MENPTWSCSPTATTWTTSSSAPSRAARTCCASRRCRPRAARHLRELLRWRLGRRGLHHIQKFFPEEKGDRHPLLSERRNIVVIADEAHRSQYDFIDGFARHMRDALPNASFIGFTGTPIELTDANTRAVFGDYISVYDIQRAVEDGRHGAHLLREPPGQARARRGRAPKIDPEFEEATEGEEVERKEKLKTKVGAARGDGRLREALEAVAQDIVEHFEKRLERWTARRWSSA
jgi:type I restriction enzyme, R subunit